MIPARGLSDKSNELHEAPASGDEQSCRMIAPISRHSIGTGFKFYPISCDVVASPFMCPGRMNRRLDRRKTPCIAQRGFRRGIVFSKKRPRNFQRRRDVPQSSPRSHSHDTRTSLVSEGLSRQSNVSFRGECQVFWRLAAFPFSRGQMRSQQRNGANPI